MPKKQKVVEIELPEVRVPNVMGWINQHKFLTILIGMFIFILVVGGVFVNAILGADYHDREVIGGDNVMSDEEFQQIVQQRQIQPEDLQVDKEAVQRSANYTIDSFDNMFVNLIGLMGVSLYDHAGDISSLMVVGVIVSIASVLLGQLFGICNFGDFRRGMR